MRISIIKIAPLVIISSLFMVFSVSNADEVDDMNLMRNVALQLGTIQSHSTQNNNKQQSNPRDLQKLRLQQWNANNPQQPPSSVDPIDPPVASDLFYAATNGNVQRIASLLAQGLNVNSANNEKETALHMATAHGHYSAVIYLVNHGANVYARTIKNWIPLHHAVRFQHPNIVNYLIQRGSSANARTSDGYSAIDIAKSTQDYRILSLLGSR